MRCSRHRGRSLASFMAILLVAMGLSPAAAAGGSEYQPTSALGECVKLTTVSCVIALAIETAQTIDDADERSNAFVLIAEAQRVAGHLSRARESLSRATVAAAAIKRLTNHDEPAQERAFIYIARAQVAIGDEAEARQTLSRTVASANRIEMPHHRAAVLSDISDVQRLAGDEDGARHSLSLSLAAADQIESEDSRFSVLTAIAKTQASSGALHTAAEIVNKVGEIYARIGPAIDSFSDFYLADVAAAQIEAGDIEGALRTAQLIGDKEDFGRALVLADIAYELAAAGDVAAAFATDEHVRGAFLRIVVVTHAGVALAEAGDIAGATRAAKRITEINEEEWWDTAYTEATIYRSRIFRAIVDTHIAAGAFDEALGALNEIKRGDYIADAAMAIAKAQMTAGDLDAARAAVDTVCEHRRGIDICVKALSALATAHASAGNFAHAHALVSLAWEEAKRTWFSPERVRAFVALWQAQIGMGDVEGGREAFAEALAVARRIDIDYERVEEIRALADATVQMGEHESAAQAFAQAMEVAGEIEDSSGIAKYTAVDRAHAFKNIGREWAQAGDWRGARKAFSQALINASQVTDDDHWRVLLFRSIASALASTRQGTQMPANDT